MSGKDKANELRKEGKSKFSVVEKLVNKLQELSMPAVERMLVPDTVLRFGMRKLLASTLTMVELGGDVEKQQEYLTAFVEDLKSRNIAEQTKAANEQHYEVPAAFFQEMLGPYLKYSSGLWETPETTLEESEVAMLSLFCERAGLPSLPDGSHVLDLGCGWGSLTLYAAERFKNLKFSCVSNSNSQREYILSKCKEKGLTNVTPKTCDINVLSFPSDSFDRVMSVEMFEHMKNYEKLMALVSDWLKPDGKLMVHIFVHDRFTYHFQEGWMSDKFFSGGTMPSKYLLTHFNEKMRMEEMWSVNGCNYSKTLEAWLDKIDVPATREKVLKMFAEVYGEEEKVKRLQDWRLFNMACSELFAYNGGNEWYVQHYLFANSKK
mmetsp:Transcript_15692/g.27897  ORF Transcript_15692/g.27897 Transcript_15692/m.27897 type:complete len:377 (-) Transcript_15692:122-1252(-)|eukprot:CAMPEP_0184522976 /NCGR_PEP_ID=MMETSP0198_2-20121128/8608_1 /TAXON_ID=1112570 /ORGANISM="Thraustochytrium sp., Strain LLF1b" /LENGTH=376 /DNA_ID=CAMNT_0026913917 /DNA_START=39 /DNA_END=1172 /DNA_ORIENTATION=+